MAFVNLYAPGYVKKPQPDCEGIKYDLAFKDWSEESILELARIYELKSGFGHFTIDNKEFELRILPAIQTGTEKGIFNSISYSTSKDCTTIFVGTEDFDNHKELTYTAQNIMNYLDIGTMKYKPIIYTKLGITPKLLEKLNLENKMQPYIAYVNETPQYTKKGRNLSWETHFTILGLDNIEE